MFSRLKTEIHETSTQIRITDPIMVNTILHIARNNGCDVDGDIICIGHNKYYVKDITNEVYFIK